jgi:putative membrane protein
MPLLLHAGSFSWTEWKLYPDFMIGWLLLGAAYFLFAGPLRRHFPESSPVHPGRIASFSFGMVIMLVALQGPLHELSDFFLFSAHMIQHLAVMLIMPPFLLAGVPGWMIRPIFRVPGAFRVARWLTMPLVAFALINVVFGAWHFPGPYDLMMRNHDVHITMHLMIMASGLVMWWPVMSPLPELPRIPAPMQMVYLFVLGVPMMLVAALISFNDQAMYSWYVEAPRIFPISALDDQRLGGVIMWVPGALVLWLGISAVYFRWSRPEVAEDEGRSRTPASAGGMMVVPPPFPERETTTLWRKPKLPSLWHKPTLPSFRRKPESGV